MIMTSLLQWQAAISAVVTLSKMMAKSFLTQRNYKSYATPYLQIALKARFGKIELT